MLLDVERAGIQVQPPNSKIRGDGSCQELSKGKGQEDGHARVDGKWICAKRQGNVGDSKDNAPKCSEQGGPKRELRQ